MSKLSVKKRAELEPKQFGLPERARTPEARKQSGNYPMPDRGHAISAIRLARRNRRDGNVSAKDYGRIARKAGKILEED